MKKKNKKKTETKMNKSVYLTFPILEIIKTLRQKFWYDYIKPKYLTNAKLCYMDTGGVINQIKLRIFTKILQMMLKNCLTRQIIGKMIKYHLQEV